MVATFTGQLRVANGSYTVCWRKLLLQVSLWYVHCTVIPNVQHIAGVILIIYRLSRFMAWLFLHGVSILVQVTQHLLKETPSQEGEERIHEFNF